MDDRMLPNGLDEYVKERIKAYNEFDTAEYKDQNVVTKDMCETIKKLDSKDIAHDDIVDMMPFSSPNTLYYHLSDKCTHEHRSRVTYSECGWMRVYAQKGAPTKTLSVLYNISMRNAVIHLTGKCNHEDGIEPLHSEDLRANGYSTPTMVSSICDECGNTFEHKEYRDRRFCSTRCRNVYGGKAAQGLVVED